MHDRPVASLDSLAGILRETMARISPSLLFLFLGVACTSGDADHTASEGNTTHPVGSASVEEVLADGVTLDQLDGVSVWCVDVGIDFGSGMFSPP